MSYDAILSKIKGKSRIASLFVQTQMFNICFCNRYASLRFAHNIMAPSESEEDKSPLPSFASQKALQFLPQQF